MAERGKEEMREPNGRPEAVGAPVPPSEAPPEAGAPPELIPIAKERLAELERKAEERDKFFQELQRRVADFDNYRKRMIRERESWQFAGLERFLRAFLPVLDDLRRAFAAAGEGCEDSRKISEGLRAIDARIEKVLSEFGVTRIEAQGERFDPNVHEAIAVRELEGVADGTIIEEIRQGYRFRDTVIRPSQVLVAKNAGGGDRAEGGGADEENGAGVAGGEPGGP